MDELSELAKKYGTDKLLHRYTSIYNEKFRYIKNDVKKVLEIGIEGGCSLKMWGKYFPNARICGIDILDIELVLSRIRTDGTEIPRDNIIIGDITDVRTIEKIKRNVGNNIDIIIDDGSHLSKEQIFAFNELFLLLKDKGYYIIEDINTVTGFGTNTVNYIKSLVKCSEVTENDSVIVKNLYSVEFFSNIIIIRKGKPKMIFYYM